MLHQQWQFARHYHASFVGAGAATTRPSPDPVSHLKPVDWTESDLRAFRRWVEAPPLVHRHVYERSRTSVGGTPKFRFVPRELFGALTSAELDLHRHHMVDAETNIVYLYPDVDAIVCANALLRFDTNMVHLVANKQLVNGAWSSWSVNGPAGGRFFGRSGCQWIMFPSTWEILHFARRIGDPPRILRIASYLVASETSCYKAQVSTSNLGDHFTVTHNIPSWYTAFPA